MTTSEFLNLRKRAGNLLEWLRLEMTKPTLDLDRTYEHAAKLLDVIETLRIVDAALQRQATADTLAVTVATEQLRDAVTDIDGMAQSAFGEIAAIAKLSLESLEKPETCDDPERIATVLSMIWSRALDAENYINCEAERVDCNYQDKALQRRMDARRQAREVTTEGMVRHG